MILKNLFLYVKKYFLKIGIIEIVMKYDIYGYFFCLFLEDKNFVFNF